VIPVIPLAEHLADVERRIYVAGCVDDGVSEELRRLWRERDKIMAAFREAKRIGMTPTIELEKLLLSWLRLHPEASLEAAAVTLGRTVSEVLLAAKFLEAKGLLVLEMKGLEKVNK
jgi:hypothetical protein